MRDFTIVVLTLIILVGLLFAATGLVITIKVATLLWFILASLIVGAVWTILLIISLVGDGIRKWKS